VASPVPNRGKNIMKNREKCFGILERVFPVGTKGMRETPPSCLDCADKTACLRTALSTPQGIEFRGELLEKNRSGGLLGLVKRWSRKKELSHLMEKKEKKK
jgi:hypothetical protein